MDLAMDLLKMTDYTTDAGTDARNYGELEGLSEARALFADVFGVKPNEVFVGGNSSLQLMYNPVSYTHLDKDISLYINSPGGSISAGMAIHDTMQYIKCDVSTICMGMAASMGAFLLASGTKGKRFALPNAEIMIHQPLIGGQGGGLSGQTTDIKIHAEHMVYIRDKMNRMLSAYTGQPLEKIQQDTERDNYLTAQQAKEYGLIDEVIAHR